jgi:hypothetical protein
MDAGVDIAGFDQPMRFCFLRDVMIYNLEGATIADSAATLIFRMSKSSSGPVD